MNVLIINTFDIMGGAARAAYRLHKGLTRIGVSSYMLVKEKSSHDDTVLQVDLLLDDDASHTLATFQRILSDYIERNRTDISNTRFSLGYPGYDLRGTSVFAKADLINLHWIDGFQSIESISSILKSGKPIVWTLHDQNPFTGGCHYAAGCSLYEKDCSHCPQLVDDFYNLSYCNLQNKVRLLRKGNIGVVSPSKWLANLAKDSMVFKDAPIVTIPNSIEIEVFRPQNKGEAKKNLGIPETILTVLTGISGWKPKRKGFGSFLSAMKHCFEDKYFRDLVAKKRLLLLSFGTAAKDFEDLNIPYKSFGKVRSDKRLCDIYNASDLFILPSVEDNLPNTVLEAMSCGTPVIAFNTGGMPDMIKDGVTGRLVYLGDVETLARATCDLLSDSGKRHAMGVKSREVIEKEYALKNQAWSYFELFSKLLPKGHTSVQIFDVQQVQKCKLDLSFNQMLCPLYEKYSKELY